MIQKVEMYQAVCDGCKRILQDYAFEEYNAVFDSEEDALDEAINCEWHEIDGKLYCPDCYEYDGETNSYKPKNR